MKVGIYVDHEAGVDFLGDISNHFSRRGGVWTSVNVSEGKQNA